MTRSDENPGGEIKPDLAGDRSDGSDRRGGQTEGPSHSSLLSPIEECSTLTPDRLYGLAGDFTRLVLPHTEAAAEALYASVVVALGNLIGGGTFCPVGASQHTPKLFLLVVGATSKARKGTSWSEVNRFCRAVDSRWADSRILSGLGSGEALIDLVAEDEERYDEKVQLSDPRVLIVEEEFSRLLVVGRREGSTLTQVARSAFDDRPLHNLTKRERISARDHHISMIGHVTLEELRARGLDLSVANGFLNRFLIVRSERSKRLPSGGRLRDEDLAELVATATDAVRRARQHGPRTRTPDGEACWAEIYDQLADDDPGGMFGALTARAEAIVLRLSLTFCLLDGEMSIDVPHLHAALDLWRFCRTSARWVVGDAMGDAVADRILRFVRGSAKGVSRTDLHRQLSGHQSKQGLDAALDVLLQGGRITQVTEETGGRHRQLYRAVSSDVPARPGGRTP